MLVTKMGTKLLNKRDVSDARSLTSRAMVALDRSSCAQGRSNERYRESLYLPAKGKEFWP